MLGLVLWFGSKHMVGTAFYGLYIVYSHSILLVLYQLTAGFAKFFFFVFFCFFLYWVLVLESGLCLA